MLLAACDQLFATGQTRLVRVSYRAPARLALHEPVLIELNVENLMNEAIRFDLGLNRTSSFFVTIMRPDGTIVRAAPPALEDGPIRIGRVSVAGSGSYSQELLMNDWSRFDQVGTYQLQITSTTTISTEHGGTVTTPTGGVVRLQIAADEFALEERCRRLADIAVREPNAWQFEHAARLLTYVDDSVGIRYMRQVLARTERVDTIILQGLARINSAEARAALADTALGGSPDRVIEANEVLRDLERRRR